MPPPTGTAPPLTTLLSQALVAFTIEFDNLAEERITAAGRRPWIVSQPMWANHLRFVGDGIPARELMERSLSSAPAIRSRLGALRRWGYVTIASDRVVRLTAAGTRARTVWEPLAKEVEDRWRARHGADRVDALRAALAPVAAGADRPLPRHLPVVGYGLRSEVVHPSDPPPAGPAGADLSAVLARALLVLTLAFEAASKLSLLMHVDGLRLLGDRPTRVRDLPGLSGCSKEAMAMIGGFLARAGLAAVVPNSHARGKTIRLTPRGIAARELGAARIAAAELAIDTRGECQLRLRQALDAVLEAPALAAGLEPRPGGWRGRPPHLTRTERVLADPRAALPHHPLVLHRGGFPDGA